MLAKPKIVLGEEERVRKVVCESGERGRRNESELKIFQELFSLQSSFHSALNNNLIRLPKSLIKA